jgi:serine phosphatase RsbU (regulator of sigma subunit)
MFLFDHVSLSVLTLVILTAVITFYLLSLKKKDSLTRYLLYFYLCITIMFVCGFLTASMQSSWHAQIQHFQFVAVSMALVALGRFAYNLYGNQLAKEARITEPVFLIMSVYTWLSFLTVVYRRFALTAEHMALISLILGLEFLWVFLVLVRKYMNCLKESHQRFFADFFQADSKQLRLLRNMSLLMLLAFFLALSNVLVLVGLYSKIVYNIIFMAGALIFFFVFAVVYLNNSHIEFSFMIKVSGITLVTILFFIGLVGLIFTASHEKSFYMQKQLETQLCKHAVLSGAFGKMPKSIEYVMSGVIGDTKDAIPLHLEYQRENWNDFDAIRKNSIYGSVEFLNNVSYRFAELVKNRFYSNQEETESSNDISAPIFRRKTDHLQKTEAEYLSVIFFDQQKWYEVGFNGFDFKTFIHRGAAKFVFVLLGLTFFILTAIPIFFRLNIIRPLNALLLGVEKVNQEDFSVKIPVWVNDEIGYLSKSFNKMVVSLRDSRDKLQEYNRTLEQRVIERTRDLKEKNDEILSSIYYAKRIQKAILPQAAKVAQFFTENFVIFHPKSIVSGDFYWINRVDERIFLAVADCTGHGVPGALMSMIGTMMLNQIILVQKNTDPGIILEKLHLDVREALQQEKGSNAETMDGLDICLCVYQPKSGQFEFAGAKRPLLILREKSLGNYELLELKGNRKSIGGHQKEEKRFFSKHILSLQSGDRMYLTTDGLADQHNRENKKIGSGTLKRWLLETAAFDMQEQGKVIFEWFQWHVGLEDQRDDVTMVGIKL